MLNLKTPLLLAAIGSMWGTAWAEDVVTLRRVTGSGGPIRVTGTIVEVTGKELVLQSPTGGERRYDATRILRVDTPRGQLQQQAESALAGGNWERAAGLLEQAANADKRTWVRRQLLADLALCHLNLGRTALAVDTFTLVYRSDPSTPLLDHMPLAWTTAAADPDVTRQAADWMDSRQLEATRLMGASWALSSQPEQAEAVLRQLLGAEDNRLASLAEAQLWRGRLALADAAEVDRWRQRLRSMPAELKPGPAVVVGLALARLDDHRQAALHLMRAPIERPGHARLAAEALLSAGRSLEKLGREPDALRLYRELLAKYPDTDPAAAVRNREPSIERQ